MFTDSSVDCLYELDALSAVTLAELIVNQSYTGSIGLPDYDEAGSYYQYRDKYLEVGATLVTVGAGEGGGSGRIKLNLGSVQSAITVHNTGTPSDDGRKALTVVGTNASNTLKVMRGSVDVAPDQGTASTIATVQVSYIDNIDGDSDVRVGDNVTLTNVTVQGGEVEIKSATTSLIQYDGTTRIMEGAHTAISSFGGTVDLRTSGTITDITVNNATLELSKDPSTKTFTNDVECYGAAIVNDRAGTSATGTVFNKHSSTVELNLAPNRSYTIGAV